MKRMQHQKPVAIVLAPLATLLLTLSACGGPQSPQAPNAPTNVTSVAGPGYVTVSWTDNSDNETGFEIFRTAAAAVTAQQAGTRVGAVGADQASYVDLEVEVGQEYEYSVVAVNSVGASAAAAAAEAVSVPIGVDLMVGTNNRAWSPDTNGTIAVVYFVFPDSMLEDETDTFRVSISGPAGWNDGAGLEFSCAWNGCDRARGFAFVTSNGITAVPGTYQLRVVAGGQTYTATATLADAGFKFPRPTDIVVTDASASGATVTWSSPPGTLSHYALVHGGFSGPAPFKVVGPEASVTFDGLDLVDGIYDIEVVPINADLLGYPLKVEPFGLSYELKPFAVGNIVSSACSSSDQVVSIPDATLRQLVRDTLGAPAGDLTCFDLALLTRIEAWDAGVTSLEGLQYANNLEEIHLHNSNVADVSPISGLTQLRVINLNLNEVSDVSPLENLTNLTELHVCCSPDPITDVTPLAALPGIEWFNITGH